MSEPTTHTLDVPGAVLTYDVRRNDATRAGLRRAPGGVHPHRHAAGAESEGEMANRGAHAVAERLGTTTVIFPSHHGGFLGGEYGQSGDPDAFAVKLREVLAATR